MLFVQILMIIDIIKLCSIYVTVKNYSSAQSIKVSNFSDQITAGEVAHADKLTNKFLS